MEVNAAVRSATIDDFAAVCELSQALDDLHVRLRPDLFQEFDGPPRSLEFIARWIGGEDSELLVAQVGEDVAGLATIQIADRPRAPMFRPRQCAVINDLVVSESYRGYGIGKLLLKAAADWASERGVPSLNISVWNDNEGGVSFFTANGFAPICQRMELRIDEAK